MSALFLKIIAFLIMLVDHAGVALYHSQRIGWVLYRVMRITGRLAFPIFCFQLIEGARYTKKKWWLDGGHFPYKQRGLSSCFVSSLRPCRPSFSLLPLFFCC